MLTLKCDAKKTAVCAILAERQHTHFSFSPFQIHSKVTWKLNLKIKLSLAQTGSHLNARRWWAAVQQPFSVLLLQFLFWRLSHWLSHCCPTNIRTSKTPACFQILLRFCSDSALPDSGALYWADWPANSVSLLSLTQATSQTGRWVVRKWFWRAFEVEKLLKIEKFAIKKASCLWNWNFVLPV